MVDVNRVEIPESQMKAESPKHSGEPGVFCWRGHTRRERYLSLALTTVLFVAVLLAFSLAAAVLKVHSGTSISGSPLPQAEALLDVQTVTEEAEALLDVQTVPEEAESASAAPGEVEGNSANASTSPEDTGGANASTKAVAIPLSAICLTQGCVKAAAAMIDRLDETVKPCDDFFQFACGNFVKKTIIPDEKSSVTMFSLVHDTLREKMRILMEEEITEADPPSTVMAKDLYASCMDLDSIAKAGLTPLRDILSGLGGYPVVEGESWNDTDFSWLEVNYKNREIGFSIDYLFDFSVTTDIKNSTWRMIWIDQPGLGMSREYLMKGLNDSDVQAYLKYSIDIAVLLGANQTAAEKEMRDVLDFQIQIANISLPREERRNMTRLYNVMTLDDVQEIMPEIPWVEYINKMLTPNVTVTGTERVGVSDSNFFRNLTKILAKTPKRVVANYMLGRVSSAAASYLSEDIRAIQLEYTKKLTGKTTNPPRWKECMGTVSGKLAYAIGNLYAHNFFNEEAKSQADELVQYVREEFDRVLNTVDWMDETTRVEAKKKAAAIKSHIAYPKELLMDEKLTEHYTGLVVNNQSLLENMRRVGIFGTNYSFKRLREMVDKLDWKRQAAIAVVNAYYSSIENSIKFPAGILQGVFFEPDRPKYMNFGGIGFVIGHEITHGFDDQGKQFNSVGNLKNWWEKSTQKKFLEKAKCIIHQYGNYTAPENGMKLNGINTQGENIADNGGVKQAYNAYQNYVTNLGSSEPTLPGLDYSQNQLFWISAAQIWCSKYRSEALKIRILTGVHSPGRFRIVGSFSNSEEFVSDWSCPVGSKMNRKKKCSVW